MSRTRLIFQNCNVYVGPASLSGSTATGALYSSGNSGANLIMQLSRVQSAAINVSVPRVDINEFGVLGRIDQLIVAPPSITLDVSYYLTNGYNEEILGFDSNNNAFASGILTKVSDSKNYFISISPQGVDDDGLTNPNQRNVYALGNGFISNYSINLAVGQIPTASFTADCLNIAAYTGASGLQTPAVDPFSSNRITQWIYQLPVGDPITGANAGGGAVSALRPGDISLNFPTAAGFLVPLSGANSVNIQSLSIALPLTREVINRIGSPFGFSREINFPINATLQIQALQNEVLPNSLDQLVCNDMPYNFQVLMRQPGCNGTGLPAILLNFYGAKIDTINLGNTLGSNSTVTLSATAQLAGATTLNNGITFSGSY